MNGCGILSILQILHALYTIPVAFNDFDCFYRWRNSTNSAANPKPERLLIGAPQPHSTSVRNSAVCDQLVEHSSSPVLPFIIFTVFAMRQATETKPPPRRKSCEGCKTAKRRCDLAFPTCSRCMQRNIQCMYPGRLPETCSEIIDATPLMDIYGTFDDTMTPYPSDADLMAVINMGPLQPAVIHSPFRYITVLPPDQGVDIFENLPQSHGFELAMPRTNPPKPLSGIFASRIQFAVDVLKDIPKMMVTETQTPWYHRQLYKNNMPKEMQGKCNHSELNVPRSISLTML